MGNITSYSSGLGGVRAVEDPGLSDLQAGGGAIILTVTVVSE